MDIQKYLDELTEKALANDGETEQRDYLEPLEAVLKGRAIELWSDKLGRLFLVADEEDAKGAMDRYRMQRGEVYTAAEARRIVAVRDPEVIAEIHAWKLRFGGKLREHRKIQPLFTVHKKAP